MRTLLLATATAFLLLGGSGHADSKAPAPPAALKPPPADVGPGRVAWFDLTTTNLTRAKEFYSKLLGWHFTALAGTDQAVEIVAGETAIGTLRGADGNLSPFNGVVYLQVADLAASCRQVRELGGTIAPGFPFNLTDRPGAIALVLDPTGHPVGLYSRTPLPIKAARK
jgi:predicted enzyme related to lactoylglutathione lyase